ncbi:alpha/beta hydrolase [Catenuloplanes japonicus]|uniref:alpha/beta hydrolase n=1 Tax=Catenuloplanes japonicus TaxID=33876 RepID=UPI0018DC8861|nr:alpha/beta hydrolase [Catenuloplanes japonicus]
MPLDAYYTRHLSGPAAPLPPWVHPAVSTTETTAEGVRLRVYTPRDGFTRALLWAHGGGFTRGDLDMPEAHTVAGELARRAGTLVVSVDYRLGHYPAGLDDLGTAWAWLRREHQDLPAAIGGASAGANLALAAAVRAGDARGLLLAYPVVHFPVPELDDVTRVEMMSLPPGFRHPPASVEKMYRSYTGRISGLPDGVVPGNGPLDGLPPATILLGEYDDLRPSGELLARQLDELGVPVGMLLVRGVLHGHLNHPGDVPAFEDSLNFLAEALTAVRA